MAWEAKPGTGTLFRNRDKKDTKHPDLRGDALVEIDGHQYPLEIAAWTKESQKAGKFLSLSIKLKGIRQHFDNGGSRDDWSQPAEDEDIPFIVNFDISPERRFRL
jgi:hypothetical protein